MLRRSRNAGCEELEFFVGFRALVQKGFEFSRCRAHRSRQARVESSSFSFVPLSSPHRDAYRKQLEVAVGMLERAPERSAPGHDA